MEPTKLLVSCLVLFTPSEAFLSSGLNKLEVYNGMDAKLWCSAGSSTTEGSFQWEYEQSGAFEKVAITNGSTLQEWFRVKKYDEDKATGILTNNLTKNEHFFGRVNITSDGSLIVMNSTVQDGGNYKCSYKGITGPVNESLIQLRVRPFKVTSSDDKSVEITNKPTSQIPEGNSEELHRYKVAVIILVVICLLLLLAAVFVGYTFHKKINNRVDEGRDWNA